MGGGTLPKLNESVIWMTGPKVFAATLELKTIGIKLLLLSMAKTALLVVPWLRLTWLIRCFDPIGGVHLPVALLPLRGLTTPNVRCTSRNLMTCSRSTNPTEVPLHPE